MIDTITKTIVRILPWRKPWGCPSSVGGISQKKRLQSEMKRYRDGGGRRVDYVETARECDRCSEWNVVIKAWDIADGLRTPHPRPRESLDLYEWSDPSVIDDACRWDRGGEPSYTTMERWSK